ncbi:MAG: sigma-70 family RNA polymerase sigma factor [Lachnospiraceae bacterium]|nr:sigma-70 family RNA polymerase sigma factor [Lachnospiraceae bacterium]
MTNKDFIVIDAVSEKQIEAFASELLCSEEEAALSEEMKKGGEAALAARNRLVEANMKFVTYLAKQYLNCGMDLEDLQSMGYEGLIHAAMKFDGSRGIRFCTYAAYWIKQSIQRGIANEGSTVRIPVHMNQTMYHIKKVKQELMQESYMEPTIEELAHHTELPEDKIRETLAFSYNMVSLDCPVGDDKKTTVEDYCADANADDPCKMAMMTDLQQAIAYALDKLDSKEALVLKLRNGLIGDHPMTLDEIAVLPGFGVTRERIRQIECKALAKIRRSYSAMERLEEYAV